MNPVKNNGAPIWKLDLLADRNKAQYWYAEMTIEGLLVERTLDLILKYYIWTHTDTYGRTSVWRNKIQQSFMFLILKKVIRGKKNPSSPSSSGPTIPISCLLHLTSAFFGQEETSSDYFVHPPVCTHCVYLFVRYDKRWEFKKEKVRTYFFFLV